MANVPINFGGGGGAGSDDCTGAKAQALAGYTFITSDSNDEAAEGTIATKSDSGNTTLNTSTTSKSYAAGYYPNAHGAQITMQTKPATPSTSAQTISPDSGKVLSSVTVGAIPNQTAGGDVQLTASITSSTFAAGQWSTSRHYVYVVLYDGSVS